MPSENDSERSALASRFRQMFPILSPTEIDRIRQFGELRRFRPGEMLSRVGKAGQPSSAAMRSAGHLPWPS